MHNHPRRGMLLLIVLAMLAMFAMVAVAFVVLAGSEKTTAVRLQQKGFMDDPPQKTLEQGIKVVTGGVPIDPAQQILPTSAITWESLLEKIYGFETIGSLANYPNQACVLNAAPSVVCGGQILEFPLPTSNPDTTYFGGAAVDPFHCVGCVLTMLDGPAAGLSTRIVGIDPSSHNVQIVAFEGGVQPASGNHYIVNGFPYSGMGFGFSYSTGALTATALTPNAPPSAWGGSNGIVPGGANSDYTAADYQDPLLALAVPNPNVPGGVMVPIPSLHRADLLVFNGAVNPSTGSITNVNSYRQSAFRPNNIDNPNFNPNLNFNAAWNGVTPNGSQWDVDNMGYGTPDSVWVDLGQPVRFTADGKAYKPLFAVLCLDMDGRLNINAHGNLAQANQNYYSPQSVAGYQSVGNFDAGPYTATGSPQTNFAGGQPTFPLARGQGTGTAEVNILPLFRNLQTPGSFYTNNYQALLTGSNGVSGRYGSDSQPGAANAGSALTQNNMFNYSGAASGASYWNNSGTQLDAFGSPPDFQAMGAMGLDTAGRPLWISAGGQGANGPYDTDLTRNAPHAVDYPVIDNPFGVAQMERILRSADRDAAMLPQRLANLTNTGTGSLLINRRAEFTTDSYMVPVSAAVLPPSLRIDPVTGKPLLPNARSVHPVDILYSAISKANKDVLTVSTAQNAVTQQLPWEVIEGLKMDLNRPFGAGISSMTTGSMNKAYGGTQLIEPDQPGSTGEKIQQYVAAGSGPQSAAFSYSADAGAVSQVTGVGAVNDSMAARQLYARHLYTLMVLLADNSYFQTLFTGTTDPDGPDGAMKRMFAQWAVNVVAYRDHNQVMIPFAYYNFGGSGNPSIGSWTPPRTAKYTVWGCKRPELLISETLAFHDRRTEDRSDENPIAPNKPGASPNRKKPGPTSNGQPPPDANGDNLDPSFNSRFRPEGSCFVELFNPWPQMEPHTPDLAPAGGAGVELTKKTPPGVTSSGKVVQPSPVWRLIVVDPSKSQSTGGDELPDPDSPILSPTNLRPTIERAVYFVPLTGLNFPVNDDTGSGNPIAVNYYPSTAQQVIVAPGGYAVVGSGDPNEQNRTYIGFESGNTSGNSTTTRMVTLNSTDVAADARVVRNTSDPPVTARVPLAVLGIDQATPNGNGAGSSQRFSISEPTSGYQQYEIDGGGNPQAPSFAPGPSYGQYPVVLDIPVDEQRDLISQEGVWATLNTNGTVPAYRIIYLQRLADPTRPYVSDLPTGGANSPETTTSNPYRTVDAMTVDLTCFNGMTAEVDPTSGKGTYHFESHQRGELNYLPNGSPSEMNLWKQEPANKSQAPNHWSTLVGATPTALAMNFPQALVQSLGYLNKTYGTPAGAPSAGDPQYPFPLLNWAYRPFNNAYELLLVPTVSSSRLLARNTGNPRLYYGYQDNGMRGTSPTPTVYAGTTPAQLPYPHLLNFFDSQQSSKPGTSAQLHRLFYYVGVPSRFANAQLQANASIAATAGGLTHYFHPPFNRINRYREPGNLNLNTITSPDVLFGMMNAYYPTIMPTGTTQINPTLWDKFVRSRRGPDAKISAATSTAATLSNLFGITGTGPSRFMQPFRTPGGAALSASEPAREADATLLREDPDVANRPLFELDDYFMSTVGANAAGTPDQFPMACMDYNRGANFRYQLIEKMGSAASTHSNVFAIWLTVGYFEVTPVAASAANPDGWQLGEELGSDTGDISRHRAFYIFDRSIPVGFIRGQDINSDKAFLLKRFIE